MASDRISPKWNQLIRRVQSLAVKKAKRYDRVKCEYVGGSSQDAVLVNVVLLFDGDGQLVEYVPREAVRMEPGGQGFLLAFFSGADTEALT